MKKVKDGKIMELSPGDVYDVRCCEIFITRQGFLVLNCSLCESVYGTFSEFIKHILKQHNFRTTSDTQDINDDAQEIDCDVSEISTNLDVFEAEEKFQCDKCECTFKYGCHLQLHKCDESLQDMHSPYPCAKTTEMFQKLRDENTTFKCESSKIELEQENELIESNVELSFQEETISQDANVWNNSSDEEDSAPWWEKDKTFRGRTGRWLPKPFPCTKCSHEYCEKKLLDKHYETCHSSLRRFKCPLCEAAFTQKGNLTVHMRRHYPVEKRYQCPLCPSKYHTRKELTKHTWQHTGERPYICDECGKGFVTITKLKDHMRRHTNERPYKCEVCDKCFFNAPLLKKHLLSHSNEYACICNICNAKFKLRSTLRNHMKLHENKREYICNICGAAFNQMPALWLHKRGKHKVIPNTATSELLQSDRESTY